MAKTRLKNRKSLLWIVVTLWLAAAACANLFPAPQNGPAARPPVGSQPVSLAYPGTPTFTPFQPLPPTETETPNPAGPSPEPAETASLVASQTQDINPAESAAPASTATAPATTAAASPPASIVPGLSIWIDPDLPAALRTGISLPSGIRTADQAQEASLRLEAGEGQVVGSWTYALAAPFPTLEKGISLERLQRAWRGEEAGPPLYMDASTLAVFSKRWGAPGPEAAAVFPAEELVDRTWEARPAWAIVPFEALEPRWKVLEVDGHSPVRKAFDPAAYPLAVPISLAGDPVLVEAVAPRLAAPLTNRDPARLTTLAMTGVTALVRATAFTMEQQGIKYPGQDVGGWLREADLTHISNEVPFARNCPYPNPVQPDVRFCSDPRYISLLEDVGTDIVELTGDHFQDWGQEAMLFTLDLYKERGWLYYGGGANLDEGRRAVTIEHNGNRLAFIGCNGKGGSFAQAGPNRPGAVVCDEVWMHAEIARLRQEGYLPIATFQHFEYYTYQAQPNQKKDFRGMAQAGAVIVSGSQAHQPQAMEFEAGAYIHYGLGNLFFDQYDISLATRQGFIDRHVFYDGRYISTELLPILFVDYARPRPMNPDEQAELLEAVFGASGW